MSWAKERAEEIFGMFYCTSKKEEILKQAIATELQRVADECAEVLWERSRNEQYGHAKAAVMLDIEAIHAKFPKEL